MTHHHQNCPCMSCSNAEDAYDRQEEYLEGLDWEIDEIYDCVDTDTFEASCIASDDMNDYYAYCTVNRGSGDVVGEIIDIDYSTVERI